MVDWGKQQTLDTVVAAISRINDSGFELSTIGVESDFLLIYHAGPIDQFLDLSFDEIVKQREQALYPHLEDDYFVINPFSHANQVLAHLLNISESRVALPSIPKDPQFYRNNGQYIEDREKIIRTALWSIDELFLGAAHHIVFDMYRINTIGTLVEKFDAMVMGKPSSLLMQEHSRIKDDPFIKMFMDYAVDTIFVDGDNTTSGYRQIAKIIEENKDTNVKALPFEDILDHIEKNIDVSNYVTRKNDIHTIQIQTTDGDPIPWAIAYMHALKLKEEHIEAKVVEPYASHTYLRAYDIPRLPI